ncbi:MAG: diacylglycerol kinase family lipid kinase [Alphaproteobacteria bacterium]|nr:diacylglycerol kinase family lipid kinase [Alphaproteobacteria bacterium]
MQFKTSPLERNFMDENTPAVNSEWMMIVNPNAGVKRGLRDWPRIIRNLQEEQVGFDHILTTKRGDATEFAARAVENGYRNIAVIGGDGTLNEVLNGLFLQKTTPVSDITLAMIPVGTGNDWCRMFQIPFDYVHAIQILKRKKTRLQDVGIVRYYHHETQENRFFMNIAGMGYDALVAKKTNLLKEKGKGGPLTYLYFVFAGLFQYQFMEAVIEVDGKTAFKGEIFSMNVGICKYNGGGMKQVPYAIPDDGLLDVTLIKKASKWLVVKYARKLFDGSLVDLPIVETFRGENIRIRSTGKIFLETDGESLGNSPFTFEILPRCLKIVTGE